LKNVSEEVHTPPAKRRDLSDAQSGEHRDDHNRATRFGQRLDESLRVTRFKESRLLSWYPLSNGESACWVLRQISPRNSLLQNLAERRADAVQCAAISAANPPSMWRLELWRRAAIRVKGCEDWIFIKLHCHGMDPREEPAMLGQPMRSFLEEITQAAKEKQYQLHFMTAREMVNTALVACDGKDGNPGDYRDYRFQLITPRRTRAA
jgi:hypothetical protein